MTFIWCMVVLFTLLFLGADWARAKNYVSKKIAKNIKVFDCLVLTLIIAFVGVTTAIFRTSPQEYACVEVLGKPTGIYDSGPHGTIPFISKVTKVDSTIQGLAIGYDELSNQSIEDDSLMITSDFNLLNMDLYAEYRVVDVIDYLYGSTNPVGILRNAIIASERNTVRAHTIDNAMTVGKSEIEVEILNDVRAELESLHTGLELVSIQIQDAEPPTQDVKDAFMAVETARQNSEKRVNEAQAYENKMIPEAEAHAAATLQQAEAKKVERINAASQEVAKFNALFEQYQQNPSTVKAKLFYEAISKVFPKMQIIVSDDNVVIIK